MYETHDLFDSLAMLDHLFKVYGYFKFYDGEFDYIMEDI
jgi:hypothetical protein